MNSAVAFSSTYDARQVSAIRPAMEGLGLHDTHFLDTGRVRAIIQLPTLVLMSQRPASAKEGIVFLTVEDEVGEGNLVVYPDIAHRDRQALVAGRLLVAEGRIEPVAEDAAVPITHLIMRRLVDRSDLLDEVSRAELTSECVIRRGRRALSLVACVSR